MNMENIRKIATGQGVRRVLLIVGGLVLVLATFQTGVKVGQVKTEHAYRWNENYQDNFNFRPVWPKEQPMPGQRPIGPSGLGGHGLVGELMTAEDGALTVRDRNDIERPVTIDSRTVIQRCRQAIRLQDLRDRELIAVIGVPDGQGRTVARFIRVMPPTGCR